MFQDPTAVSASGGTGITGWRVDGPLVGGGPPPGYAPSYTTDPTYTQNPIVSTSQAYAAGTVDGNPTPTRSVQWLLDGVAIPGETTDTYTPVVGDIGSLLSLEETWTNTYGTVSATPTPKLVTPAMAAAAFVKYIDPTLAGGSKSSGDAYTPAAPLYLYDGSACPAGKIYATCKAAYDSDSSDGIRYYLLKDYCHDPVSSVFFAAQLTASDTLISSYGPVNADPPVLDAIVYLDDATGWTPNGTKSGAWDYDLPGVTTNNTSFKGRLWVGRQNGGDLISERPIGTARRRAANSVSNLSLTNNGENKGLWYITAGSPSVLTVMADVSTEPPIYHDGIGLAFDNMTACVERGIVFRNGASNCRVEGVVVQGAVQAGIGVSNISSNSVSDSNAFVDITVSSYVQEGVEIAGANASRTVTNTYVSGLSLPTDGGEYEQDEGTTNDFSNANPIQIGGFTDATYLNNIEYEGYNVHTVFDPILTSGEPPENVYVDGVVVTFLPGATDGRAWGGYAAGGYFKNFRFTDAPARSQWAGSNFEIAYGLVESTGANTNKDPDNQFQAFKFATTDQPSGATTSNLSIHDVEFDLTADPLIKAALWFEGYDAGALTAAEEPDAGAVSVYDCTARLSTVQGLVARGVSASRPNEWPDQDIHDNTVINASSIGQNFSVTNSQSSTPTYTTQALNGFFGCVDNTVSTS